MTKTQHYNLPQWEASDPIRREDFNAANAAIDAALQAAQEANTANAQALAGKAAAEDVAALNTAVAAAQATADAAWSPSNPFFATGSYRGSGTEGAGTQLKITTGFRPSAIFIGTATMLCAAFGPAQKAIYGSALSWDDDGVTLTATDPSKRLDSSNSMYYYCAFR